MSSLEYERALSAFEEELNRLYTMEKERIDVFSIFENINDSIEKVNDVEIFRINQSRDTAQTASSEELCVDVNSADHDIIIPTSDKNNEYMKVVSDRRQERSISEYNTGSLFNLFIQSIPLLRAR